MKIDARVYLNQNEKMPNLRATANVTLDDCFAVRGIRIIDGNEKGLFVAMPSQKIGDEYKEQCFPVTKEFREQLNGTVMTAYQQKLDELVQQAGQGWGDNVQSVQEPIENPVQSM